jgi:hypothetical protein
MSEQNNLEKEISPFVVGLIGLIFSFAAPFLGGRVGNLLTVLGGWGFCIGFVVMMWKRTDTSAKAVLIIGLLIVLGISANLNAGNV